jgi:ribosomal protein S18 acetylase RimI-like enzyme
MANYLIRDLDIADCADIISIYYSYYDELKAGNATIGIGLFKKKPSYGSEVSWFADLYNRVLEGNEVAKVAVVGGKVVGLCNVGRRRPGSESEHIGGLGIAVKDGFRSSGIGTALMEAALKDSSKMFEVVVLEVFTINAHAIALYKKMGFVEYGMLPHAIKRGTRYYDEYLMYKELSKKKSRHTRKTGMPVL